MPRFLVTNSAGFDPFSFDELVKPLMYKQEQHNAAQDAYDAITTDTAALAQYISNNPDDSSAKELYDNYMSKVQRLNENLDKYGVSAQTRRDLSIARKGYAEDIQRLRGSIERRLKNSEAFQAYAHKNNDAIMGIDPGTYGLNKYLEDPNFGGDWFSYSGNSFMSEVAADAVARAKEYRRNVSTSKEVPGYITRIADNGFSGAEVDAAVQAVKDGSYSSLSDGPVKILADTLAGHIASTGAQKGVNISDAQYERFFDYGRTGLSQAILGKDQKDFNDYAYEQGMKKNIIDYEYGKKRDQALLEAQLSGMGNVPEYHPGNNNAVPTTTSQYGAVAKETKSQHSEFPTDGTGIAIKLPDGTVDVVYDEWEATDKIYNSAARNEGRNVFNADIALPAGKKQEVTVVNKGGRPMHLYTGNLKNKDAKELGLAALAEKAGVPGYSDFVGIYRDSDGTLDAESTKAYNFLRAQHEKHVSDLQKANPKINFNDFAISPKKERKIREKGSGKEYNIPQSLNSNDVRDVIQTKAFTEDLYPSYIVGPSAEYDFLRENLAANMYTQMNNLISADGKNGKNKELSKGSPYRITELGEGNTSERKATYGDLRTIFGANEKTGDVHIENLNTVMFDPYDIAANPESPKFRFTSKNKKGIFKADATLLGDYTKQALTAPVYNGRGMSGEVNGVVSPAQAIQYMMLPLTNPDYVKNMSEADALGWGINTASYLGTYPQSLPSINAADYVGNSTGRALLYSMVVDYINSRMAPVMDEISNNPVTHSSLTSNKKK